MTSLAADPSRSTPSPSGSGLWKKVALPAEHGSWGLVGEPVLLGLLVAWSPAALLVGLGSFAGFLAHRPLKLLYGDLRRGRRYPRTHVAGRFAAGFTATALACFAGALALAGPELSLPLAFAVPLAVVFLLYDLRPGRSWQAELAAPAAFASAASAMAMASGWALMPGLALWAVMAARAVPSVLYVRERVRLERGSGIRWPVLVAAAGVHLAAAAGIVMLVRLDLLPALAAVAMVLLVVRAAHGLTPARAGRTPQSVGFQEIGWGVATVLLVAAGFWNGV